MRMSMERVNKMRPFMLPRKPEFFTDWESKFVILPSQKGNPHSFFSSYSGLVPNSILSACSLLSYLIKRQASYTYVRNALYPQQYIEHTLKQNLFVTYCN